MEAGYVIDLEAEASFLFRGWSFCLKDGTLVLEAGGTGAAVVPLTLLSTFTHPRCPVDLPANNKIHIFERIEEDKNRMQLKTIKKTLNIPNI